MISPILLLIAGAAGDAPILTLERARAMALQQRPELAAARAEVAAAEAARDGVDAAAWPSLSLSAQVSASPGSQLLEVEVKDPEGSQALVSGTLPLDADGTFEPLIRYAGSLGLSWSVWDFGRRAARRELAAAEGAIAAAREAETADEVRRAVDLAYLGWLAADARRAQIEGARAATETRLQDAQGRVEAGVAAGSSLLSFEVAKARARLREAAAQTDAAKAYLQLKSLLGDLAPDRARPDPGLLHVGEPSPEPEISRAAEARLRAAEASAQVAARSLRPEVVLEASAGLRGQQGFLFPVYQGGVGLRWPLFDGGRSAAAEAEASARARAAKAVAEQESLQGDRRRESRVIASRGADRRVVLATELLEAARRLAEDAAEQFAEGRVDAGAVSRADDEVLDAKARLLEARLDGLRARLGLDQ
ncbi:MAG: TolC family protein [Myxococcota bacterium]